MIRDDRHDLIYKTRREKYNAIVDEIERLHELGCPVLVGTVSVEVSETLSRMLKRARAHAQVLNAKYHQREAEIVAGAGQRGAITIATNMAGRGTDIKLGEGEPSDLDARSRGGGGLHIIGTERHESRRIDRQLRGRVGPPGRSGRVAVLPVARRRPDAAVRLRPHRAADGPDGRARRARCITHPLVTRSIEQAQKRVELQNFQAAKRLLEYDDVMNQQREVIYSLRLFALEGGEELKAEARKMIEEALERARHAVPRGRRAARGVRPRRPPRVADAAVPGRSPRRLTDSEAAPSTSSGSWRSSRPRRRGVPAEGRVPDGLRRDRSALTDVDSQVLSQVMLNVLDEKWKDHLYDLDQLRNAIQYRAWGQKDPLVEYKREAFEMFEDLMRDIQSHLHRAVPQDSGER